MRKISVFNHVTVDGYFAGPHGEIDWFKSIRTDAEYDAFIQKNSSSGGELMFGRITYEMMKGYWPTAEALKASPEMANTVNNSPKLVFSKSLRSVEEGPHWKHITLLPEITKEAIGKLKAQTGQDITILGSGSIVRQLTDLRSIDEYGLVCVPLVLGTGQSFFKDVRMTNMKLVEAISFKNGLVWKRYQPID